MLFIGPSGSGKTHFVLSALERAVKERRAREARLVVPTASMAQHLTHILVRRGCVVPGELIQTLADFVAALTPDLAEPSTALDAYLHKQAIAAAAPQEFSGLTGTPGLQAKLAAVIAEFQAAGCGADAARPLLNTPHQVGFGIVFREYEDLLRRRELAHRNERLLRAAAEIRRRGLQPVRELYFDGFFHFSHGERELIEACSETTDTLAVTIPQGVEHPFEKMPVKRLEARRPKIQPEVVSAASPQSEIEEIARLILEAGRPFRDFLVIVRALEVYAPLVQAVFERFGVPFRLRAPRPLAQHGAVRYFRALLASIAESFPGAKTLDVLRQPYSPIGLFPQTDVFDFRVQEKLPNDGLPFLLEQAQDLDHVRASLERLGGLAPWSAEAAPPKVWAERCRALRLDWFRLPEIHDSIATARAFELRELAAALRQFDQTADEAADWMIDPSGGGTCKLSDYLAVLDDALAGTALRVADHRHNVVNVVTVFEARQWETPVAFVCGLVERQFPRHHGQDLFFPDADRRRLRSHGIYLRTSAEREQEERFLYEIAVTRATAKLVLTYARRDEREQPLLRSFLLPADYDSDRHASPVRVREQPPPFEREKPASIANTDLLREIVGRHTAFSPSSLETYLQCPYQFFASKTLRLKGPPDDPSRRLDPLLVGSIIHRAIANWSAAPDQPIDAALDAVLDETLEARSIPRSFHTEMLRHNLRTDLARFAGESLSKPMGDAAGQKREAEVRYAIDDHEQLFINGRIDRYDVFGANCGLVVDYKYSSEDRVKTIVKEHEQGERLQAPLYLLGLQRNLGIQPAGMRFWGLRRKTTLKGWIIDGLFPEDQILEGDETLSAGEFEKKLNEALQTAIRAIDEIRAGRIQVEPRDRDFCRRFCDFRAVCRVEL